MIFFLTTASATVSLFSSHVVHLEISSQTDLEISNPAGRSKQIRFPNGDLFFCEIPKKSNLEIPRNFRKIDFLKFSPCLEISSSISVCPGRSAIFNDDIEIAETLEISTFNFQDNFYFGGMEVRVKYVCSDSVEDFSEVGLAEKSSENSPKIFNSILKTFLACDRLPTESEIVTLIGGRCLKQAAGIWNYELCFGGAVMQNSLPWATPESFFLGDSSLDLEISSPDFEALRGHLEDIHWKIAPKNYRLKFSGGENCDGEPRRGEIWFQCPPEPQTAAFELVAVLEIVTCVYRFIVNAAAACADPRLAWRPRKTKDDEIKCRKI